MEYILAGDVEKKSPLQSDMAAAPRGPIPAKVLELTRSFYEALLTKNSQDFDELDSHSQQLISVIERDIEAIKIADTV